jgi:putative intracellular protease/amidase
VTGDPKTAPQIKEHAMPALDNLRVAVIATDGVEEPELAEPVRALREAGARTELLSVKPGQIQAVRHDLQPTQKFAVDKTHGFRRLGQTAGRRGGKLRWLVRRELNGRRVSDQAAAAPCS